MIIDAMDVLYGGNVDGFQTGLRQRLHEVGGQTEKVRLRSGLQRNGPRLPVLQWETPSVEEAHKPEVPIGIGTSGLSLLYGGRFPL